MSTGGKARLAGRPSRLLPRSPRQELTAMLLLGAVGAGLILLATKQDWAQVRTSLPRPLPDSHVAVTGAALVPYADALVVAGLATLAAVLASKRLLRRLTGAPARGHRGRPGRVGVHAQPRGRDFSGELVGQPGNGGGRLGDGRQRNGDHHAPGCRGNGNPRGVLRGWLAGAGRRRRGRDDGGRARSGLAGQPAGRDVQPLRRADGSGRPASPRPAAATRSPAARRPAGRRPAGRRPAGRRPATRSAAACDRASR